MFSVESSRHVSHHNVYDFTYFGSFYAFYNEAIKKITGKALCYSKIMLFFLNY